MSDDKTRGARRGIGARRRTTKGAARKGATRKSGSRVESFTPAEQRAARAARIYVTEAEPEGWLAHSEGGVDEPYWVHAEPPPSNRLSCECADFTFRAHKDPGLKCKHIVAVILYCGNLYIESLVAARGTAGKRVA